MGRIAAIAGLVGALIGLGAGFLWWALPLQSLRTELADTRARVEKLEQQQPAPTARPDEAKGLRQRIGELEADLARERAMRDRLQAIISQGRK
jgi:hypothetical protein